MKWLGSIIICLLLCGCQRKITEHSHTTDTLIVRDTVSIERVVEVTQLMRDTIREEVKTTLVLGADSTIVSKEVVRNTYVSRNNATESNSSTQQRTASNRTQRSKDNKVQTVEVERPLSSLQRTIMGIGWLAIVMVVLCAGFYWLVFRRRH
jgi:cobalamin biosynthesis Mg chelatase CobN